MRDESAGEKRRKGRKTPPRTRESALIHPPDSIDLNKNEARNQTADPDDWYWRETGDQQLEEGMWPWPEPDDRRKEAGPGAGADRRP